MMGCLLAEGKAHMLNIPKCNPIQCYLIDLFFCSESVLYFANVIKIWNFVILSINPNASRFAGFMCLWIILLSCSTFTPVAASIKIFILSEKCTSPHHSIALGVLPYYGYTLINHQVTKFKSKCRRPKTITKALHHIFMLKWNTLLGNSKSFPLTDCISKNIYCHNFASRSVLEDFC